jgi:diadenosine tetraphosphate (Ap4A) HIT family hydrolase
MKKIVWASLVIGGALVTLFSVRSFSSIGELECPFCAEDLIDNQSFASNHTATALLTYKPIVEGHVLVIPQRHVERFEELSQQEVADIQSLISKVHTVMAGKSGVSDYLLLQKNGKGAGQTVPHVHFHYLPRSPEVGSVRFIWKLLVRGAFSPVSNETLRREAEALALYFPEPPSASAEEEAISEDSQSAPVEWQGRW